MTILFGSSSDKVVTSFATNANSRSYYIAYNRTAAGGSTGQGGRLWSKRTGAGAETESCGWLTANSNWSFQRNWTSGANWTWTAGSALNALTYLVLTYNSSSIANSPVVYINGVSAAVTAGVMPLGARTDNAEAYMIGNRQDGTRFFSGQLGPFAIWDRILTGAEITALAAGTAPDAIGGVAPVLFVPMPVVGPALSVAGSASETLGAKRVGGSSALAARASVASITAAARGGALLTGAGLLALGAGSVRGSRTMAGAGRSSIGPASIMVSSVVASGRSTLTPGAGAVMSTLTLSALALESVVSAMVGASAGLSGAGAASPGSALVRSAADVSGRGALATGVAWVGSFAFLFGVAIETADEASVVGPGVVVGPPIDAAGRSTLSAVGSARAAVAMTGRGSEALAGVVVRGGALAVSGRARELVGAAYIRTAASLMGRARWTLVASVSSDVFPSRPTGLRVVSAPSMRLRATQAPTRHVRLVTSG